MRRGLLANLGEAGKAPKASPGPELAGVDAVVGGAEQAQIAAAVAIGPQHRLLAAVGAEQSIGPQVPDQARILLGATAVLALVAAGEQATASHCQAGGDDAVHAELVSGRTDVELRRGRDDDDVMALVHVPLESVHGVVPQVLSQMLLGEPGGPLVHLSLGEPAEQTDEETLLGLVGRGAPQ